MFRRNCHLLAVVATASPLGCGDDLPDGVFTTALTSSAGDGDGDGDGGDDDNDGGDFVDGDGEDSLDDTAGTSETGDETGDSGADGAPCNFHEDLDEEYYFESPPEEAAATLIGDLHCDFDGILVEENTEEDANYLIPTDQFDVWIYHPQEGEEDDDWPEEHPLFPAVFMSPGGGQQVHDGTDHLYLPMFEAIARAGFVAIAINPVGTTGWSSGKRRAALACAMIWAREDEGLSPHLADVMAVLGHSRGGGAAWLLTLDLLADPPTNLPQETPLDEWEQQCATISIAQRYGPANMVGTGDRTNTRLPINHSTAPPFLGLYGAIDEDTTTQPIAAFDSLYAESRVNFDLPAEQNDELFVLIYGHSHNSWGGQSSPADPLISPYYIPRFLRWQILGEQEHRAELVLPTAWDAASGDFESPIASAALWTNSRNNIFYSGCEDTMLDPCPVDQGPLQGLGRPLIYADYTQGITWNGASRFELDLIEGVESGPYCEDFGTEGSDLPDSTWGGTVVAERTPGGGDDPIVCEDSTTVLLADRDLAHESFDGHETGAMLVQWGGALGGATIRWSLPAVIPSEISTATHLSFRIGNVLTDDEAGCDVPLDEITMTVELRDDVVPPDADGPFRAITPIIDPQSHLNGDCRAAQFMHTVRIPLQEFCEDETNGPLAIDRLSELVFHFPDDDETHTAMIDSLQFTHDPYLPGEDPTLGECPQAPASSWNCIADELVATETSCSGEPISGECDIIDIEEDPVALPEVEIPNDTFDGWVVHVPKGWLRDPGDPTEDELDDILDRCIAACELEYADDPFVAANCDDPDAFLEPTLRNTNDIGALVSIPAEHAHGEDVFVAESVECDLRSDCSTAFDENLGPSRLRRPSPQSEPLHRGEEWLVTVTGDMEAGSSYAAVSLFSDASAAMGGTVGYSRCAPGNAPETCPFYLGSMELELQEPLTLDLECDSVLVSHELTELTLRLAQPAFGVSEDGTTYNGFTPGGLVIEAQGIVDELPFTSRRPIEQPVYVDAADGLLTMQGELDGFVLEFEIPCNGLMADVAVGWSLVEDEVLEGPPTLGIGHLPATMECPDELPLSLQWTSDPDSDYESLQWIVDGVLLDGEFPTLAMTESHEITAILRDSRGASGSATTTVACE